MTNVINFPGPAEGVALADWFTTIVQRVEDEPLQTAIVILVNDESEMIVYTKDDMRKDQYVGVLEMAKIQGIFSSVSY